MTIIRPATTQDIPTLENIYGELFSLMAELQPDYYVKAKQDVNFLKDMIASYEAAFLIAESASEVLGFIIVQQQETPAYNCIVPHKLAYIVDLAVTEASRGLGIGKALMKAAEAWAKDRNLDYIELGVLHENDNAKVLYEKLGFNDVTHIMRKPI